MSVEKARIAQIQFGNLEIEGLMLPNGSFAIGVSQISKLLPNLVTQNHATRQVKSLLGKASKLPKTASELNKKPVNIISLLELEKVIIRATAKGDSDALALNEELIGLSLTQLWSDAFGVKFEKEDRIAYIASREEHRKQFHTRLTPWWKLDGCEGQDYRNRVVEFKTYAGLPEYKSVDEYTTEELAILNQKEVAYCALRKAGIDHIQALRVI